MKYRYIIILFVITFYSCEKDTIETFDNSSLDNAKVTLVGNHIILIADGTAELALLPLVYETQTYVVDRVMDPAGKDPDFGSNTVFDVRYLNDRFKAGDVKYFLSDGTPMDEPFYSTTSLSPGKLSFYAEIAGQKTNNFTVTIVPPLVEQFEEVVFPIVFHNVTHQLVETNGGGIPAFNYERLVNGLNTAFSRIGITSPNGANAKIKFKMAEFDSKGKKMETPGINTIYLSNSDFASLKSDVKSIPEALWDVKKYFNVWVMNTGIDPVLPTHALEDFTVEGINAVTIVDETFNPNTLDPVNKGIILEAHALAQNDLDYGYIFGTFFGLLETKTGSDDFCDDTFVWVSKEKQNSRWKLNDEGMRYFSVNLMDESSARTTLSQQQVLRVREVIEKCPVFWSYKSNWAFTGE